MRDRIVHALHDGAAFVTRKSSDDADNPTHVYDPTAVPAVRR
jgi:hypothetical protein